MFGEEKIFNKASLNFNDGRDTALELYVGHPDLSLRQIAKWLLAPGYQLLPGGAKLTVGLPFKHAPGLENHWG